MNAKGFPIAISLSRTLFFSTPTHHHYYSLRVFTGSSPELPDATNLGGLDMTQLALWNFCNGVVKPPLQQPSVLPFQPATRPHSRNSNSEAPLDLGKCRKEEKNGGHEVPNSLKRKAPPDDDTVEDEERENESDDSDSDSEEEEAEGQVEKNSSQGKSFFFFPSNVPFVGTVMACCEFQPMRVRSVFTS